MAAAQGEPDHASQPIRRWRAKGPKGAPVHDRMPVILTEDDEAAWLSPDETESEFLLSMLRPAPDDLLRAQVA